jgi:hypothetical protein
MIVSAERITAFVFLFHRQIKGTVQPNFKSLPIDKLNPLGVLQWLRQLNDLKNLFFLSHKKIKEAAEQDFHFQNFRYWREIIPFLALDIF